VHLLKSIAHAPAGYARTTHPDGRVVEQDTRQCCHCCAHFPVREGSGKVRGFCPRCMDYTCGNPACDPCNALKQRLKSE